MRPRLTPFLLVMLLTCAAGCGGGDPRQPGEVASELLEPLTALGPCQPLDLQTAGEDVPGLVMPPEATVVTVSVQDPLTTVQGYVRLTPIQMRVFYERQDDLDVISVEDEVWESEALVSDGEHRLFVKTQAVCEDESQFVAVVAPEAVAAQVPTPAGGAGTQQPVVGSTP